MPYQVPHPERDAQKALESSTKHGTVFHLEDLPGAYQLQRMGIGNLGEVAAPPYQAGLQDYSQGDYQTAQVATGSPSEGISYTSAVLVSLTDGQGGLQYADKPYNTYGDLQLVYSLDNAVDDPSRPQDPNATIEQAETDKDAKEGQSVTTQTQDEQTQETVITVNNDPNPYGEPEEIKPVLGEDWG